MSVMNEVKAERACRQFRLKDVLDATNMIETTTKRSRNRENRPLSHLITRTRVLAGSSGLQHSRQAESERHQSSALEVRRGYPAGPPRVLFPQVWLRKCKFLKDTTEERKDLFRRASFARRPRGFPFGRRDFQRRVFLVSTTCLPRSCPLLRRGARTST